MTTVVVSEKFLASLDMHCTIAPAREADLKRAEELSVRASQHSATGYTYSYDELTTFSRSPSHDLRECKASRPT